MKNSKGNWKDIFPDVILERGRKYYEQGKVSDIVVSEKYLRAIVYGSRGVYFVMIHNPGDEQMGINCDCPYAKKGHACKHVAAVLYKWEKEYCFGGDDALEEDIFAEESGETHFFDIRKITREFVLDRKKTKLALEMIKKGEVRLEKFSTVQFADSYSLDQRPGAVVRGVHIEDGYEEDLEIIFDRETILRYNCRRCGKGYYGWYYDYATEPCAHIIALILLAKEYISKFDPGDYTDRDASVFLDAFGKERAKSRISESDRDKACVELEPRFVEAASGMELNFRIGNGGKLYVLKNLEELHMCFHEKKSMKLGKNTYIDFMTESFNEDSEKLFQIIENEIKRIEALEEKYYMDINIGRGVPLTGDTADKVYEILHGGTVSCKFIDGRKDCVLSVREDEPVVNISINPDFGTFDGETENTGIYVSGKVPYVIDGVKGRYFVNDKVFSVLDEDLGRRLNPFIEAMAGKDGNFGFLIGRNRTAEFYHKILPELMDDPVFRIREDETVRSLVKDEAEFSFFLDAENGMILCRTEAAYGDDVFSIKPTEYETYPLDSRRDINQERPVTEIMNDLFEDYDDATGSFFIEDTQDARYEFLKSGMGQLFSYGDVNSTDSFDKIKIRRFPVVQMGVRLENNLLDLTVQNDDMTSEELAELLQSYKLKKTYHRMRNGEFIDLEENESADALMDLLENTGASLKDFVEGKLQLPAYRALYLEKMLEGHDELVADRDRTYRNLIRNFKAIEDADFDVPESLKKVLRQYQAYGFKWMKTLGSTGFGGILADDMGLGKTLQVISLLLYDKENDPDGKISALVVCPASLVYNWIEEIARFAPELSAVAVAGTKGVRRQILSGSEDTDILVTSYDLLKRDIDLYDELEFTHQIIDEAQYIKNAGSVAAKSVKLIHSDVRFALTGTPIENRLSELWSIFDYLMPGFLYGYEQYRRTFETPISKYKDEKQTEALRNMISPFLLRRKKADVLKDLPDKIEELYYAKFEKEQQRLYDAQVDRMRKIINAEDMEFEKSKIQILAELMKIRQICCDPGLLFDEYKGGSAKREACLDMIRSAIDGEHRCLVFSQFTTMLAMLEDDLKKEGIEYYKLTGSTSKEERSRLVKEFNTGDVPVFLISLKAGGTGLNLTGADIVIHYDPWWNRAAQDQATDRAHRIGQTKDVTVYQLIAKGSIEERIVKLQNDKKELADAVLSGETRSLGSMSKEELLELLGV